jgi:hypothetical protein
VPVIGVEDVGRVVGGDVGIVAIDHGAVPAVLHALPGAVANAGTLSTDQESRSFAHVAGRSVPLDGPDGADVERE